MPKRTIKQWTTIKQANAMIHGRQSINLSAKRLLIFAGKKIDATSQKPNEVRLAFGELANFITTRATSSWKGRTQLMTKIFKNLNENPLLLLYSENTEGEQVYEYINWLQSLKVEEHKKEIVLVYTDAIRQFFVYLKSQPYTNTVDEIGQYKSIFTIRIKEMIELEQFKDQHYFDLPLEQFKWKLGVEKRYAKFYDFKRKVLEVAQKELKEKQAPVQFTFDTLGRHGQVVKRSVYAIRIYPQFIETIGEEQPDIAQEPTTGATPKVPIPAPALVNQAYLTQYPRVFKTLTSWGISVVHINKDIDQKGIQAVKKAITIVASAPQVRNRAGLYIRALQENWETEEVRKKQAAQTAKKQQLASAKQKQTAQQLKDDLASEAALRENAICDDLIAKHSWLLEKAYQQFQDKRTSKGGISLQSFPDTAIVAYKLPFHKWRIVAEIKALFPTHFELTFANWSKERPVQYQHNLREATAKYTATLHQAQHNAEDKQKIITSLLVSTFKRLYNQ